MSKNLQQNGNEDICIYQREEVISIQHFNSLNPLTITNKLLGLEDYSNNGLW